MLSVLIKEVITKVEEAGFKIVTTVCDLGGNNVKALEFLGSTWLGPWFEFNGHRIYTIYDICHLLKCTRNNFRNKGITLKVKVKGKPYSGTAKWEHITKVVHEDRKQGWQGLWHIKDEHVDPKGAQKMKVNLAARIFSKTMASNIADQHDYSMFIISSHFHLLLLRAVPAAKLFTIHET
nr:PREDICTED: uncharacterized protein LOC109043440 [Bemisia tabaci]